MSQQGPDFLPPPETPRAETPRAAVPRADELGADQPPPGYHPPLEPAPRHRRGPLIAAGIIVGAIVLAVAVALWVPSADESESSPQPTEGQSQPSEETQINPGYNPSPETSKPFAEPREDRPPVEAPSATPEQTWPTFPPAETQPTGWQEVMADDGTSYRIPAGWTDKGGLIVGYETLEGYFTMRTVSYDREDGCDASHPYSMVGLVPPIGNASDLAGAARTEVTAWAQMRNTEYEGDYYDVPLPEVEEFTFDNGRTGALATISFVPKHPSKYECPSPAMRFTVVAQADDEGVVYLLVSVAHIGLEESLDEQHERQVLATLETP